MKTIFLTGENIDSDKEKIIENYKDTVFLYTGQTINMFIENLSEKETEDKKTIFSKFRICYERLNMNISISYIDEYYKKIYINNIKKISSLIEKLDEQYDITIVIENNEISDLIFVYQQFIFIRYPFHKVKVVLKKEESIVKINEFIEKYKTVTNEADTAIRNLNYLKERLKSEYIFDPLIDTKLELIDNMSSNCAFIKKRLEEAKDTIENKAINITVAGSKKAGKSLFINCIIGQNIQLESYLTATPCNCYFSKSNDNKYHLEIIDNKEEYSFDTLDKLKEELKEKLSDARNDIPSGYSMSDMRLKYVNESTNPFSSYEIIDTPGPDASHPQIASNEHKNKAEKAIYNANVIIFLIDFTKYLQETEFDYLKKIYNLVSEKKKLRSLIIVVNKIDKRDNDVNETQSVCKIVDFIRNRIREITHDIDVMIFPISAMYYNSLITVEKEKIPELQEEFSIDGIRNISKGKKELPELKNVYTNCEYLSNYYDCEVFSLDFLKSESGVPALLDYILYISSTQKYFDKYMEYFKNFYKLKNFLIYDITKYSSVCNNYHLKTESIYLFFIRNKLRIVKDLKPLKTIQEYVGIVKETGDDFSKKFEKRNINEKLYEYIIETVWNRFSKDHMYTDNEIEDSFKNINISEFYKKYFHKEINMTEAKYNEILKKYLLDYQKIEQNIIDTNLEICKYLKENNITINSPCLKESGNINIEQIKFDINSINIHIYKKTNTDTQFYREFFDVLYDQRLFYLKVSKYEFNKKCLKCLKPLILKVIGSEKVSCSLRDNIKNYTEYYINSIESNNKYLAEKTSELISYYQKLINCISGYSEKNCMENYRNFIQKINFQTKELYTLLDEFITDDI